MPLCEKHHVAVHRVLRRQHWPVQATQAVVDRTLERPLPFGAHGNVVDGPSVGRDELVACRAVATRCSRVQRRRSAAVAKALL